MLPLAIVKMGGAEKRGAARRVMEQVGLGSEIDRLPNQLSGGEQERVAIARAIVKKPQILLADEPAGNLDSRSSAEIMALLRELNAAGQTIIMVTHNCPGNGRFADRQIFLKEGMVVNG